MAQARQQTFPEGAFFWVLDQVQRPDGSLYISSDIASLGVSVYDLDSATPRTALYTLGGLSATGIVLDTPLVSNGTWRWVGDDVGANLAYQIAPTLWSTDSIGGHLYRIEIALNTNSDGVVRSITEARCLPASVTG